MIKILDFYADWCGPCRMMSPILDEIGKEYPEIEIWKIDVESSQEVAITHDIQTIPTFFFYKDDVLVQRISGFISKNKIKEILAKL